jgi:Ca-activated chloride channel family protein
MNLVHPHYVLAAVAALFVLLATAWLLARARRRAISRFASPALADGLAQSVSRPRRAAKLALLSFGVVGALLALARPQWGWRWEQAHRNGVDILFAVDTSKSMLAEDVRPSRLARAKLAVHDLVDRFEGDRAGLVAFAGEAFLQAPITLDRDAFGRALDALDTDTIPRAGTDVAAAIREANAAFGDTGHDKVLVLLTDGEALEGDAVQAARDAARDGVRIFAVGVGGTDGALVPVQGADGRPGLLRGPDGELVRSRLDEATLRQIAAVSHGDYEPFGASGEGLRRLYERDLSTLPRHAIAERRERVWFERFQVPLAMAVAALVLEALLGERRRARSTGEGMRRRGRGRSTTAAAAMAAALVLPASVMAQDGPPQIYNGGVSAYRAGDFAAAGAGFERALRDGDLRLQARAYYNLGNARFRAGEASLEHDRTATRTAWEAASHAYESALRLSPNDDDAQHNLALVRRRLAGLDREDASHQAQQRGAQQQNGQQGAQQQNGQQGAQQQNGQQGAQGQNGSQQGAQQQSGQQQGTQGQNGQQGAQQQNGQQQGTQGQNGQQDAQQQNGQQQGAQGQNGSQQPAQGQSGQQQGQQSARGPQHAQSRDSQGTQPSQGDANGSQNAGSQQSAQQQASSRTGGENAQQPPSAQTAPNTATQGAAQPSAQQHGSSQSGAHAASAGGNGEPGARLDARDAAELLDSMRHEERRWPLTSRSQNADASPTNPGARRDW